MSSGASPQSVPQVDLSKVEAALQRYMRNYAAPSTKATYASAQQRYIRFCRAANVISPYSLHELILCKYVAYLADQGLKHRTIKAYLSSLRFAQIHVELGNPFQLSMPQLEYVLAGIKRVQAHLGPSSDRHLPVTIDVLHHLHCHWKEQCSSSNSCML